MPIQSFLPSSHGTRNLPDCLGLCIDYIAAFTCFSPMHYPHPINCRCIQMLVPLSPVFSRYAYCLPHRNPLWKALLPRKCSVCFACFAVRFPDFFTPFVPVSPHLCLHVDLRLPFTTNFISFGSTCVFIYFACSEISAQFSPATRAENAGECCWKRGAQRENPFTRIETEAPKRKI